VGQKSQGRDWRRPLIVESERPFSLSFSACLEFDPLLQSKG
jgi:hypothetical protein